MLQNAAAMSATCSYASVFAPKENELHVVHGTKYVPYIDDDARLEHIDFVELAVEAIERMLDTNSIDTYVKQHGNAASIRIDVDGQGQKTRTASSDSCPDVVFDHVDLVHVIGEAKATLKDLQSAHAAIQLRNYVRKLATIDDESKLRYLILSVPYQFAGTAKKIADNSLSKVMRDLNDDEVTAVPEVRIVTEIDGKDIDTPDGWDVTLDAYAQPHSSVVSSGGKVYPVTGALMDINDLAFDDRNIRLLGIDGISLNTCDIKERLLDDANIEFKNVDKARARRSDIIGSRCIKSALDVLHDASGAYVVIDGNSRLAFCRDITERAASADSYRKVPVRIYDAANGIDADDINYIKNDRQHSTVLPHDTIRDAYTIYAKIDELLAKKSASIDNAVRMMVKYYKGIYSDNIVRQSYETIKMLKENGVTNDAVIRNLYYAACLLSPASLPQSSFNRAMASRGVSRESVLEHLVELANRLDDDQVKGSFLTKQYFEPVARAIKPVKKSQPVVDVIAKLVAGAYDDEPSRFVSDIDTAKNDARKTKDVIEKKLTSIESAIKSLNGYLAELDVEMVSTYGFSKNGIIDIADRLNQADETLRELGDHVSRVSCRVVRAKSVKKAVA